MNYNEIEVSVKIIAISLFDHTCSPTLTLKDYNNFSENIYRFLTSISHLQTDDVCIAAHNLLHDVFFPVLPV